MAEYVYARHDFIPEHDDEITFHAGERIEVVEKDEQFGDGWWLVGTFSCSFSEPICCGLVSQFYSIPFQLCAPLIAFRRPVTCCLLPFLPHIRFP